MARTYRKVIRCGICHGTNTDYYRDRRRLARRQNNHMLRNLMANYAIEDVDNIIYTIVYPHDDWNEPTDGTFLITKDNKKHYVGNNSFYDKQFGISENYWNHKFGKYLKNKH